MIVLRARAAGRLHIDRSRSGLLRWAALLLAVLFFAPRPSLAAARAGAGSEAERVSSAWGSEAPATELVIDDQGIALSLDDAVTIALRRNLRLQVQRLSRAQSAWLVSQFSGIYDLRLDALGLISDETSASASNLDGADVRISEVAQLNLGLAQLVPTGGTVQLDWLNQRFSTNSIFSNINPSFTVNFDLLFDQPLLRGFGRESTERDLIVARNNSERSRIELELAVVTTVDLVENAYWTLVENRAQLGVAEESLKLANELHQMNKTQVEVGTLAPLELIQSEVGIATRQEEIIRAQAAVEDAADELRRLLNLETDRYWGSAIRPTTDPETARIEIGLDQALAAAQADRPELARQELVVRNLELDSRVLRHSKLPQLNLQLRYGWNGLGGDVRELLPGENPFDPDAEFILIPGGYDDALDQIIDRTFEGWQAALNFALPLQNRAARAQSTIADLALEQGATELAGMRLDIRAEVRQAVRAVQTAAQQIDSARVSRRLAEENVAAERKRYENGLSTSFQVLEIQEDLSQARSREVSAVTGYRRALLRYYQAVGRLLEEKGIELVDEVDAPTTKAMW